MGGMVIVGSTLWILEVTKVSLTSEVRRLLLPTDSSPQMHIRTVDEYEQEWMVSTSYATYLSPSPIAACDEVEVQMQLLPKSFKIKVRPP